MWQYIAAAVFAVAMLVWQFWPAISSIPFPKFRTAAKADTPIMDTEMEEVAAMHLLKARFKRLGCKDGQAAMAVVATHFFHEEVPA